MDINLKNCDQFLRTRPEFYAKDIWSVAKNINLECYKDALDNTNADFTEFLAKMGVVGTDGQPRYCYWGELRLSNVSFFTWEYRGDTNLINESANQDQITMILFDSCYDGLDRTGYWGFNGFIIDRNLLT